MGRNRPRRRRSTGGLTALLATTVATLGIAAPAWAATPVGQTFDPDVFTNNPATFFQTTSPGNQYAVPSAGVLTSWSFQADVAPPASLKFKVGRQTGAGAAGGIELMVVGEGRAETPVASQLNVYSNISIPVQAGDLIGYFAPGGGSGNHFRSPAPGYEAYGIGGDQPAGSLSTYFPVVPNSATQLDVAAVLEPDADCDNLGDETQDPSIAAGACPPGPFVTITERPKDKIKTKKKRAKVTFAWTADEPDPTFNCTLDGKQEFKACTSPLTVTVKKGSHTFEVRATDAGANPGEAATDTFKVKRKKKKKK
jgi:hypothetical protein